MSVMAERILEVLDVVPIEKLKIHEQTIEKNVTGLKETMLNIGRLVDPLIVDRKNYIVLDGNHRRQVLEMLKASLAVCQLVNYEDKEIQVGGWFPAAKELPSGMESFKGERVDFEAGITAISKKEAYFMLVEDVEKKNCTLFPTESTSLSEVIGSQQRMLKKINGENGTENGKFAYFEDVFADDALSQEFKVLYRKPYTKEEIVSEALAGRPLPPKSTRHMIPNRIIRLNLPLGWLYEDREDAKGKLEDMVRKRAVHHNVRRYTEPVIVIY
ncbi:hypothetical protein COV61_02000 [Candidatus Micrarchaeota archaeon CG11_big_fil_rev_8_21_14_0_20_47_5]|nr:MAG: hypothetical protein AUJ17_04550 [Candidatus Micrarchaeota archaeon CG1_02_47_40]PIN83826.1 MAG: hypothetical protein COV61_02000 [Candidatus Micrarchaeota archaeon CG11_big_fil_rev_8_21_14_0_20_47_5]